MNAEDCLNEVCSLKQENWQFTSADMNETKPAWMNFDLIWKNFSPPANLMERPEDSNKIYWIKTEFSLPYSENPKQVSLRLGVISDSDEIFINGEPAGKTGDTESPLPQGYDRIRIYDIPPEILNFGTVNTLYIKVKPYFRYEAGILSDRTEIGPSAEIHRAFMREEYSELILLSVYLFCGVFSFLIYLRSGKEKEYLIFAEFIPILSIYLFLRGQMKYELNLDFIFQKKTEYISLLYTLPVFCSFVLQFSHIRRGAFEKILNGVLHIICLVYIILDDMRTLDIINRNIVHPLFAVYCIYTVRCLLQEISSKDREDIKYLLYSTLFLGACTVLDILRARGLVQIRPIFDYAFFVFILGISAILVNRFVRMKNLLDEINRNLETKVKERTKELEDSYLVLKELKNRQDADYFLTSLLLKPLQIQNYETDLMKVEFFTIQKKIFEFRGERHEIGGDLNMADRITLEGKKYLFFCNSDAMGKSIQGAGGALVFGSVLRTLIYKAHTRFYKNCSPERFLKDVFIELQRVFEGLNGVMLVSALIGVVEEASGLLYYINSEHPYPVLYRNGIAQFLEKEQMRKFGTPYNSDIFRVNVYPLFPGDCFFAGSDGKDDLLSRDADGTPEICLDISSFLRTIENTEGIMKNIHEFYSDPEKLTDDVSLIRIEIRSLVSKKSRNLKEVFPSSGRQNLNSAVTFMKTLYKAMPANETALRFLSLYYFRRREFNYALRLANAYNNQCPDSWNMLYLESVLWKKMGNFRRALSISEQIYLRNPDIIKNLKNRKELFSLVQKIDSSRQKLVSGIK